MAYHSTPPTICKGGFCEDFVNLHAAREYAVFPRSRTAQRHLPSGRWGAAAGRRTEKNDADASFRKKSPKGLDNRANLWYIKSCLLWHLFGGVAQLARAFGSYPKCHWFESSRRYHTMKRESASWPLRPVGQVVKTRPFHGCNMGSNPVRVTIP